MAIPTPKAPDVCPKCDADFDGGEIPEELRKWYSPPYRVNRCIWIIDPWEDLALWFRCPDCGYDWAIPGREELAARARKREAEGEYEDGPTP